MPYFLVATVAFVGVLITVYASFLSTKARRIADELQEKRQESIQQCRKALGSFFLAHTPPYTFDVPVSSVCGPGFQVSRSSCDTWFCDYEVLFEGKPVFRITRENLMRMVDAENIERLNKIASAFRSYQLSFADSRVANHLLDLTAESGWVPIEEVSDVLDELGVEDWSSLYGTGFFFCVRSGDDCSVNSSSYPFSFSLKYQSPYGVEKSFSVEVVGND